MSASVYRLLSTLRKNRARYLYVPNQMLGGDSDCSTLLTFDDVAQRLNGETQVYLPKVIMEHPSKTDRDISGVTFDEFKERFPRIRFKVLQKVNSKMSNSKLYEKGYLKNVVEDYLDNPLAKRIEEAPLPN